MHKGCRLIDLIHDSIALLILAVLCTLLAAGLWLVLPQ